MRKFLLVLLAALPLADAVACTFKPTAEQKLEKSDTVFTGRATSASCEGEDNRIEFKVEKIWKGKKTETQTLFLYDCKRHAHFVEPNEDYLVYAVRDSQNKSRPYLNLACPGSVMKLDSTITEWLTFNYLEFKYFHRIIWEMPFPGGAHSDLKRLDTLTQ